MLTQQCVLPPLTSTVKSLLFTHVYSSPLSLAAMLHQCCVNHFHYINNGWTFSGHTLYFYSPIVYLYVCVKGICEVTHGEMFKLTAKYDAHSLFYSFSHFECDGDTVHMLTQLCLPPPLTSTVKWSLFTYVHSSPLSLASRLHRCHTNHSHYINNGWTFSTQTLYLPPKLLP